MPKRKPKRQFTYMGLLHCADCGCAITAEIKKGKYVYYHCTNGKGSCSKNYVREEVIDEQIKATLQSIKLDETRLDWVKEALKLSHQEEKAHVMDLLNDAQDRANTWLERADNLFSFAKTAKTRFENGTITEKKNHPSPRFEPLAQR